MDKPVLEIIGMLHGDIRSSGEAPQNYDESQRVGTLEIYPRFVDGLEGIVPGQAIVVLLWLHQAGRDVLKVYPRGRIKESAMTYYTQFAGPFCGIVVAGDEDGLRHLHLNTGEGKRRFEIPGDWQQKPSFFDDVVQQLMQYFSGVTTTFSMPLNPQGTAFQKKVWQELQNIPYGRVRSYKDIAQALGNEKAARAVGMANAKNPVPIIIPCHRVIGADGSLTGFAHGVALKDKLLRLEGFSSGGRS